MGRSDGVKLSCEVLILLNELEERQARARDGRMGVGLNGGGVDDTKVQPII